MTLSEKLNRIPPCIARILAKSKGRLITDRELASRTGWSMTKLRKVSMSTSWERIAVGDVDTFLSACSMRWSSQQRARWILKITLEKGGVEALKNMRHLKPNSCQSASQLVRHIKRIERLFAN